MTGHIMYNCIGLIHFGQQPAAQMQDAENDTLIIGQQAAAQLKEAALYGVETKRLKEPEHKYDNQLREVFATLRDMMQKPTIALQSFILKKGVKE